MNATTLDPVHLIKIFTVYMLYYNHLRFGSWLRCFGRFELLPPAYTLLDDRKP